MFSFFCLLLSAGTFTLVFIDKCQKSHKIVEIRVFLLFLRSVQVMTDPEAQKHKDQDPQH
jgi:hypothetical protein